ncbi:MAG: hypothetical protein KDJ78_00935 [Rhodobacteraceae bacterium]|uniref:hypothetical protein n=1 Tax=Amaricoccus sp. TaxID=1872485 RepID=UPI001D6235A3|nr:hypothetical protein [Amaricoccus sp.]MCB1372742.1 hypothetical protein [Paracoccaceae bacterium]MCC0067161.1 hypothetical protein [Rhodovulum sp.]HRW13857.1 hypothetical protein [Amaricoccus sp.]
MNQELAAFTMLHLQLLFDLCGPDSAERDEAVDYVHSDRFAGLCSLLNKAEVPAKMKGLARKSPEEREEYLRVIFMRRKK